jgi:adenosylcobinamide-GDP ribazoletransferase
MSFLRHFLLAVQFFTRIPITGPLARWVGYSPQMLRASAAHFAGVGWIVGAVSAGVYAVVGSASGSAFMPWVAACLCTAASAMLTGGFHEDGLADVADGLGGSYERERALEIMKDSRVGAFGAIALVLALVTKLGLLAVLGGVGFHLTGLGSQFAAHTVPLACLALLCAHVVSRACPMVLVRLLPHVGDTANSKSKPLADHITIGVLLGNALWCALLLPLVWWAGMSGMLIAGSAAAVIMLIYMGRMFAKRLQGFTGDCLGATQQVCEIAFYFGALLAL